MKNGFKNLMLSESEKSLLSSLANESIELTGFEVVYIPRTYVTTDSVLNEITSSEFKDGFSLNVKLFETGGFSPNDIILGQIGMDLSSGNVSSFSISREHFLEMIPDSKLEVPGRPNELDLLYIPHVQQLLSIIDVDTRNPHISGGDMWLWIIKTEPYRNDHSPFESGIVEDNDGSDNIGDFWDAVEENGDNIEEDLCEDNSEFGEG